MFSRGGSTGISKVQALGHEMTSTTCSPHVMLATVPRINTVWAPGEKSKNTRQLTMKR